MNVRASFPTRPILSQTDHNAVTASAAVPAPPEPLSPAQLFTLTAVCRWRVGRARLPRYAWERRPPQAVVMQWRAPTASGRWR